MSGFSGTMKEIIQMNITALRTSNDGTKTSWLFTSLGEELNQQQQQALLPNRKRKKS